VGAVKTPPVRVSKPERSRVLEDAWVTVSTLKKINRLYFHPYLVAFQKQRRDGDKSHRFHCLEAERFEPSNPFLND
jgi:hypothetical protein